MTRIDPGVVSLVAELRGRERQAAEELGQWKTHHEERKVDRRLAGGDHMSQALNRLRAMVSPPRYSQPMPRPPSGGRGWMT